jgi:hypothetical protein
VQTAAKKWQSMTVCCNLLEVTQDQKGNFVNLKQKVSEFWPVQGANCSVTAIEITTSHTGFVFCDWTNAVIM